MALVLQDNVLLIEKQRPEWQKGRLNGVGGKIEPGEADSSAMIREFAEETGLMTYGFQWKHVCTMTFEDSQVLS